MQTCNVIFHSQTPANGEGQRAGPRRARAPPRGAVRDRTHARPFCSTAHTRTAVPRPPKGKGEATRNNVVMSAGKRSCPDPICYLLSARPRLHAPEASPIHGAWIRARCPRERKLAPPPALKRNCPIAKYSSTCACATPQNTEWRGRQFGSGSPES